MPRTSSLGYLLGQGLFHFRDGVVRPAVFPGSSATVSIRGHLDQDVQRAIACLQLLGGLGSRNRRGWGSLSSTDLAASPAEYRERIATLLNLTPRAAREWSHLTPTTRFTVIDQAFPSWHTALDALGAPMSEMRQNLGGRQAPYGPDHDLVSDLLHKSILPKSAPRRAAFGLPHPYFFKSSKKSLVFTWNGSERRASPLLLHVAKLTNGYAALAMVMSGPFLPAGSVISTDKQPRVSTAPPSLQILNEYLDRLAGKA